MKSDTVLNTTDQRLTVRCPAKLNLTFAISGDLPGGYHEVETLLQAIDLEDELTLSFAAAETFGISIKVRNGSQVVSSDFPLDGTNLIARAARLFAEHVKQAQEFHVEVVVEKRIPIAAGLAGGSANAAATLSAMNKYFGYALRHEELLDLAAQLGADVPFCLIGGRRIGTERGDKLSEHHDGEPLSFVIIKPRNLAVSTAWVYKTYDEMVAAGEIYPPELNVNELLEALSTGEIETACKGFGNVFEQVVFPHYRDLIRLRQQVLELGAWSCRLTGSGPTLYAVVANVEMAHMVRRELLKAETIMCASGTCGAKYDLLDVWIASSVDYGASILNSNSESPT